jgi:glycosyltransferase involved in cell wall biosynthesis
MNILLINHYAGSERHGMEYRPFYLSREWVKLGHRVTIVAASASHLRVQAPDLKGDVTEEEIEGIHYIWLKTPGYSGNGVGRARNIMAFVFRLLLYKGRLVRDCRPDVVIASSTYPLDAVPARRIARECRAKLVYEVHDLWPLSLIELAGMSPWHPFVIMLQRAENFACRNSDRVASMLPKADLHMRQHGMADHKFAYVPNGIHVAEWQREPAPLPEEHRVVFARLKEEGRFVVGYAGSHGLANSLHTLVDAAALVQTEAVAFVLVGHGPEKAALQQRAQRLGLRNTVFLPPVPKLAVPRVLSSMDALFMGCNRRPIYRFGISPNKLVDYMMAAKPVVNAVEAGNDIVSDSGCGITIAPEDPQAVAAAVTRLICLPATERAAMGSRGREYVLAHHDYRVLAQQFLTILQ